MKTKIVLLHGSDEFTVQNVAAEGDRTVGGIYARFKSKDELLRAVMDAAMLPLAQSLETERGGENADSIETCLDIFTSYLIRHKNEHGELYRHLLLAATNRPLHGDDCVRWASMRKTCCAALARLPGYEDPFFLPAIAVDA